MSRGPTVAGALVLRGLALVALILAWMTYAAPHDEAYTGEHTTPLDALMGDCDGDCGQRWGAAAAKATNRWMRQIGLETYPSIRERNGQRPHCAELRERRRVELSRGDDTAAQETWERQVVAGC